MSETNLCPNCGSALRDGGDCLSCATQAFTATRAAGDPRISGYEILGLLGEGGMGAIYLAEEKSLGRRVAIKVISGKLASEPQARARFLREARSLATVEHPNVVRVYSFGEVDSHPYLAMEYVDGETLAERIRRSGMLPVDEAIRILRQILEALDAAWEKGIVHRDIKPSNVLLDRRGQVHVVDFGLAKSAQPSGDSALTQMGSVLGTPYYLAPEQAQGEATDFRADVYSCGILLYEMLTGERPFEGTTPLAIVARHIHEPMPSVRTRRKDVPSRVVRLLEQMTAKKPAARASSYAELLSAIDGLLGITPARPITPIGTIAMESPRRLWLPLSVAAAVLLIVAAVSFRDRLFERPSPTTAAAPSAGGRFVVAVAPFYGPDSESEREGRMMAALIERSIHSRLGEANVRVIGIDETKTPVRHNDAARELGERLSAGVVVWGEAFALRNETEIQPHFTIVAKAQAAPTAKQEPVDRPKPDLMSVDPTAALEKEAPAATRLEALAPNQIELRKTSAEGVGEMVSLLAAVHALYTENDPAKALAFLDRAPRSIVSLRARADAYLQRKESENATATLRELLAIEPDDAMSHARLADLALSGGRTGEAVLHYKAAAASGQPYDTRNAIYHDGLLFQRETYRAGKEDGNTHDSGYLLAVNPESGIVVKRYRMPGVIESFTSAPNGFTVAYVWSDRDVDRAKAPERIRFSSGRFDQPIEYVGGNLLLRMRAMKSGWVLAENFIGEFTGVLHNQPARPAFRLNKDPNPEVPTSLPELETALREAIRRDPTQPWHLFFLGQTLAAEGRADEAKAVWSEMLSRDFPVPYTNWAWISKYFERLEQRDWADRAWEKAVRERRRIPQPVQFSILLERLINVAVMRLHPSQLADPERAYTWLVRAREISGVTEADHLAAASWARHFSRRGDPRAESEQKVVEVARSHPFNWPAQAAKLDYALHLWISAAFGLFASLFFITGVALDRARTAGPFAPLRWRNRLWLALPAMPRILRAVIVAFAISAVAYVAIHMRIEIQSSTSLERERFGVGHLALIIALLLLLTVMARLFRVRSMVAQIRRTERVTLLVAFLVCLIATLLLIRTVNQQVRVRGLDIGLADSIGHPRIVSEIEERLSNHRTRELRYGAAVANDLAGNAERAKSLYRDLPDDPRARQALEALEKGHSSPVMPSASELYAAYSAGSGRWWMREATGIGFSSGVHRLFNLFSWCILATTALILIASLFAPAVREVVPLAEPVSRWRRWGRRTLLLALPGSYDLLYRSAPRGMAMLALTGFAAFLAILGSKIARIPGAVGIISSFATVSDLSLSFPLPPDHRPLDLYFVPPHAPLFWAIAAASLLALIVLHVLRLPAILRLGSEQPAKDAPTLVAAGTQPARSSR